MPNSPQRRLSVPAFPPQRYRRPASPSRVAGAAALALILGTCTGAPVNAQQHSSETRAADAVAVRAEVLPYSRTASGINLLPYAALPGGSRAEDDGIRCLLPLPAGPLMFELRAKIDDVPLAGVRRRRVEQWVLAAKEQLRKQAAAAPPATTDTPQPRAAPGSAETPAPDKDAVSDEPAGNPENAETAANAERLSPSPSGTPPPEATAETDTAADQSAADQSAADPLAARLVRYWQATGREPDVAEAAWLLRQWQGPAIQLLSRHFQVIRSTQAPVWDLLDRNHDGSLSGEELTNAAASLRVADRDRDALITAAELADAARAVAATRPADAQPPLGWNPPLPLLALTDYQEARHWMEQLVRFYATRPPLPGQPPGNPAWLKRLDPDGDGELTEQEYRELLASEPDLTLHAAFHRQSPAHSRLEARALPALAWNVRPVLRTPGLPATPAASDGPSSAPHSPPEQKVLGRTAPAPKATEQAATEQAAARHSSGDTLSHAGGASGGVVCLLGGAWLELHLGTLAKGDDEQVALGVVSDGYPLLPLVDIDGDLRLSERELLAVTARLAALDTDGDGSLRAAELPPTVRLAVARGLLPHRMLGGVRRLYPPPARPAADPPRWFVRSDRNRDGDVSRQEFLGTQEQFKALDRDGDTLISAAEALAETEDASQPQRE